MTLLLLQKSLDVFALFMITEMMLENLTLVLLNVFLLDTLLLKRVIVVGVHRNIISLSMDVIFREYEPYYEPTNDTGVTLSPPEGQ